MNSMKNDNSGYFARLWNGQVGLAQTFWFWGFFASNAIGACVGLIDKESIAFYPAVVLALLFGVAVTVAIWRSSNNYYGPRFIQQLVKISIVIGGVYSVFSVVFVIYSAFKK